MYVGLFSCICDQFMTDDQLDELKLDNGAREGEFSTRQQKHLSLNSNMLILI